jgi:hypothetical protein
LVDFPLNSKPPSYVAKYKLGERRLAVLEYLDIADDRLRSVRADPSLAERVAAARLSIHA